ncbi:NAD-dependent epimerase/dehydratase family protein [Hymenobacter cheonanensis]|uniref:NAD-dependent epimerase/dehydratase family protein n=1 Tax=Hymenobacter sp. CA2-7 TaxID=3063993 RepID=UPI002712A6F1|nr:NAD-dependent epimerase/dehydratase family protein [Hymenobacter sp. CA2-7]MDO7884820.1 NAD-dependent epimerase/dehydratase family protein [Hymenobacter sp. CA2-7]
MAQRIILTGATGMVGEGVLLTCLAQPGVEAVLSISRRPSGHAHPKLRELLVPDLADLSAVEKELVGYTACFFCAGISSAGMKEAEYTRITHDLTLAFARTLARVCPGAAFVYVSGAGTSANSRLMWARVKGRTENDLLALPFRAAYMFRPAFMEPVEGQQHVKPYYKFFGWLAPGLRRLFPGAACTLREVGLAMLHAAGRGAPQPVLEVRDLVALAAG